MASGYLRLMLDSARRCAAATQDAAEDARKASEEARHEAQEIDQMAQDAASKAVEASGYLSLGIFGFNGGVIIEFHSTCAKITFAVILQSDVFYKLLSCVSELTLCFRCSKQRFRDECPNWEAFKLICYASHIYCYTILFALHEFLKNIF